MNCIYIIQQISLELGKNIIKKALSGGISDIDALTASISEDCRETAKEIVQVMIKQLNTDIREDKQTRRDKGLTIKEKDRPRELLTDLGTLKWTRDYYYDQVNGRYTAVLDAILGIRKYERIGDNVSAAMVNHAADISYAGSADIVTGGRISRQSVRNHVLKLDVPEQRPACEKKKVKELHIYADEDHVHMQKPDKKRGKKNQEVPLAVVTEGTESIGRRRNKTIDRMCFVDEDFSGKKLWKSVEGYIGKAYDPLELERIYIHGDGGAWISEGLDTLAQSIHVIDGYHFEKRLKTIAKMYPSKNVKTALRIAIRDDDRKRSDDYLQTLLSMCNEEDMKDTNEFRGYLFNNWDKIRNYIVLDIPGSCTEGQVSHILSERFSRDPMGWSKAGLSKLSKVRVYRKNGGMITGNDFKPKREKERYSDYADRLIREYTNSSIDWSIFEIEQPIFNGSYGTQEAVHMMGVDHGIVSKNTWS